VSEHSADYSKHTDEQLAEGIAKINAQETRIAQDDSEGALDAARDQREQMEAELRRRQGDTWAPTPGQRVPAEDARPRQGELR